jgi:hypothetical protein
MIKLINIFFLLSTKDLLKNNIVGRIKTIKLNLLPKQSEKKIIDNSIFLFVIK